MTQREFFNEVIAIANGMDRADLVEFANGRIAQLDKKNASSTSKSKKLSDEQISMRDAILEYLGTVEQATVAEISVAIGCSSSQKVTGNLTQLVKADRVTSEKGKKSMVYKLA